MVTRTVLQTRLADQKTKRIPASPAFHASRLPTRSLRKARQLPLGPDAIFSWPESTLGREFAAPDQRIEVAEFRCLTRTCNHQVFAEHADQLKKLDLPATSRVEVRQHFSAEPNDRLSLVLCHTLIFG